MPDSEIEEEPTVTYSNTVKHWVLYALDAIECEHQNGESNPARENGTDAEAIYEHAGGEDSIVFRNPMEVRNALSEMARLAPPYQNQYRPVNRRTAATSFDDEIDVDYSYRLTQFGRERLVELGVPDELPNRRDYDTEERELPEVQPSHRPDWWMDSESGLDADTTWIEETEWVETDHDRVYYHSEADAFGRGEDSLVADIADAFPEATFVITMGPYRLHDIAYVIRDPFERVVQIDVYSPMTMHRNTDEIEHNISYLVNDLHSAFERLEDR